MSNERLGAVGAAGRLQKEMQTAELTTTTRTVSTLLSYLGRRNLDRAALESLEAALAELGLHCSPSLRQSRVGRSDTVSLSMSKPAPLPMAGKERDIVRLALGMVGQPGRFYNFRLPRGESPAEWSLPSNRRVDMVLRSVRDGRAHEWVLFEFKKGRTGAAAVEQLVRYMKEFETDRKGPLRGVIVAGAAPDEATALAAASASPWPIEWWVFTPEFEPVGFWEGASNGSA